VTAWSLAYDGYDPAEEGQREALCTLGNGFFACGPTLRRCRRSIPCASGESRRSSSWPKDNRRILAVSATVGVRSVRWVSGTLGVCVVDR
jgi:hypothetical protein